MRSRKVQFSDTCLVRMCLKSTLKCLDFRHICEKSEIHSLLSGFQTTPFFVWKSNKQKFSFQTFTLTRKSNTQLSYRLFLFLYFLNSETKALKTFKIEFESFIEKVCKLWLGEVWLYPNANSNKTSHESEGLLYQI